MLFGLILVESAVVFAKVLPCGKAKSIKEALVSIMFDMD